MAADIRSQVAGAGFGRLIVRTSFAACALLIVAGGVATADSRPITKLQFDPTAEKVELFKAMADGQIDAKLIHKNSLSGNLILENKTDKPLTVEMPESFVGVQVPSQFGGGGLGGGMGGLGGGLGGQGGGQAQSTGGGMGGQGLGGLGGGLGGGMGGAGANFFSIPPEKRVLVPVTTVCLEHGKAEPSPRMTYRIVPVSEFSKDARLNELLKLVASGRVPAQGAQAAAWHLSNEMSWRELATKSVRRLGGAPPTPYFTRTDLMLAQELVSVSHARAARNAENEPTERPAAEPVRAQRTSRTSR